MGYSLCSKDHPDYLWFRYSGVTTRKDCLAMLGYIGRHAESSDRLHVLIEEIPGTPNDDPQLGDVFFIARRCAEELFPLGAAVAMALANRSEATLEAARFAELVAFNRGLLLKFFTNVAEAEAWLWSLQFAGEDRPRHPAAKG